MNAGRSRGPSAKDVFIEVAGYYRHASTEFEITLWMNLFEEFGDEACVRFLYGHVQTSVFMPKVAEARALLDPQRADDAQAFERLGRLVARYGSYQAPQLEDQDAADRSLRLAIALMGGWVAVAESMPAPSSAFAHAEFFKRFAAARRDARSRLVVDPDAAESKLLGLIKDPPLMISLLPEQKSSRQLTGVAP